MGLLNDIGQGVLAGGLNSILAVLQPGATTTAGTTPPPPAGPPPSPEAPGSLFGIPMKTLLIASGIGIVAYLLLRK